MKQDTIKGDYYLANFGDLVAYYLYHDTYFVLVKDKLKIKIALTSGFVGRHLDGTHGGEPTMRPGEFSIAGLGLLFNKFDKLYIVVIGHYYETEAKDEKHEFELARLMEIQTGKNRAYDRSETIIEFLKTAITPSEFHKTIR